MNKVELTDLEHRMLNLFLERGGFSGIDAPTEEMNTIKSVIDKASNLLEELNAYDEMEGDLMKWFYKQVYQTSYPDDDASDVKVLVD